MPYYLPHALLSWRYWMLLAAAADVAPRLLCDKRPKARSGTSPLYESFIFNTHAHLFFTYRT
jgi:hypothetical protein